MTELVRVLIRLAAIVTVIAVAACATSFERPRNLVAVIENPYQAQRQSMSDSPENGIFVASAAQNLGRCQDMDLAFANQPIDTGLAAAFEEPAVLSPGDFIRLEIIRGEGFEGDFVISPGGFLRLPYIGDIPAAGITQRHLEATIARLLVTGGFYRG